MFGRLFLIVLALGMFLDQGAEAALKSSKAPAGETSPAAAYNPNPTDGDIELPMPNGMKMVLRAVAVPTQGDLLKDKSIKMGGSDDPDRAVFEREFQAHVAAPFKIGNLPRKWQDVVGKSGSTAKDPFVYYFLGKYEISNGQWDAIMGTESGERPDLPKANISWYDLQDFLRKYNEWLMANHPEALPAIDGQPGFFRLPNEAEWQYAAMGGNTSEEQRGVVPGIETEAQQYAIFGSRYENPAVIGSRNPNQLGIHDMGGNVAELVQDGFRIPIIDTDSSGGRIQRLHGSEGGLIIKGGSYLAKDDKGVQPGNRNEQSVFKKGSDNKYVPFSASDVGARLILTTVNTPGQNRLKELQAEEKNLQKGGGLAQGAKSSPAQTSAPQTGERVSLNLTGDPVAELEKIYAVAQSEDMKKNLAQLRTLLGGVNEALSRERDGNLQNAINSTVYMAEAMDNIAYRCFDTSILIDKAKKDQKAYPKERLEKYIKGLDDHFQNLLISTNVYRLNVENIARLPENDIERLISILADQHRDNNKVNNNYKANLKALEKHIKLFKNKGRQALSNKIIWDDIVLGKRTRDVLENLQKKNNKARSKLEQLDEMLDLEAASRA